MNFITGTGAFSATRLLVGFILALAIAAAARSRRALTRSGAAAAVLVGTVSVAAGYGWGVLLIAFFASATLLSRFRRADKARRTAGILEKDDERDAVQVLANGGLFAAAATMMGLRWWFGWAALNAHPAWTWSWMAIGAGAIAAACADTWSTEIGMLARSAPRMITTGREVPVGTSGGVTGLGLVAMVGGAAFMGLVVWLLKWPPVIAVAAAAGGTVGALSDSLIGALFQSRRRCPRCDAPTEREVHDCGADTVPAGGLEWLDNDIVNALSTGVGALAAAFVASRLA